MNNCEQHGVVDRILRCIREGFGGTLLRPLALDAFISETTSEAWARELSQRRRVLIEHVRFFLLFMDSDHSPANSSDTGTYEWKESQVGHERIHRDFTPAIFRSTHHKGRYDGPNRENRVSLASPLFPPNPPGKPNVPRYLSFTVPLFLALTDWHSATMGAELRRPNCNSE